MSTQEIFERFAGSGFKFVSSTLFDSDRRLEFVFLDPKGQKRAIGVLLGGASHEEAAEEVGVAALEQWGTQS